MNDNNKKKKKKEINNSEFEFCEVCRLSHNQGRRHIYFPKHKTSLSTLLSRFQSKLTDVKSFLKSPTPLRPDLAEKKRLWCIFCSCDILELDSSFACENAIVHLASGEHLKRVKDFMWKHGGGMDRVDAFRITVDFAKWEKRCKSLKIEAAKVEAVGPAVGPSNNIHNELNADNVNSFPRNNLTSFEFNTSNSVTPLQSYTHERVQELSPVLSSCPVASSSLHDVPGDSRVGNAGCLKSSTDCSFNSLPSECPSHACYINGSVKSGVGTADGGSRSGGLSNRTQVSSTSQEAIGGNVHTGAPPPWFDAAEGSLLDSTQKTDLGDSRPSEKRKSSKLNPKRVGAAWAERRKRELELERRGELVNDKYDANWLPNFGRVWQSGTRKESRKEFQTENSSSLKVNDQSESSMPLQPYVSKRKRRDTSE